MYKFRQIIDWATVRATFSPTYLVTLIEAYITLLSTEKMADTSAYRDSQGVTIRGRGNLGGQG
jgi:hypothetical protein